MFFGTHQVKLNSTFIGHKDKRITSFKNILHVSKDTSFEKRWVNTHSAAPLNLLLIHANLIRPDQFC